jgi:bile acid:Na+ symporter, BASS family
MDIKNLVMLALQVSILATVFGIGLGATVDDLLYVVRRPGLFARSLFSVFVIMPIVAVTLVRLFDFPATVKIVLVALAISPVPPLLPKKETRAGGHASYGLGLMAILALVSIVAVPAALELLARYFGRPLTIAPSRIAGLVLKAALMPLGVGMAIRALFPAFAERLETAVTLVVKVMLPAAVVVLLVAAAGALWALIASSTILAMVIFTVAGLAIGHVLGGPDPDHASVLALSTACRHPAIALAIAATNFPNQHFGGLILIYVLVSAVIGIPYVAWQRRQMAGAVRAA